MGINVGGIDLTASAIDSEFRIRVLEKVLDRVMQRMGGAGVVIPNNELEAIRNEVLRELQAKYPRSGINFTR